MGHGHSTVAHQELVVVESTKCKILVGVAGATGWQKDPFITDFMVRQVRCSVQHKRRISDHIPFHTVSYPNTFPPSPSRSSSLLLFDLSTYFSITTHAVFLIHRQHFTRPLSVEEDGLVGDHTSRAEAEAEAEADESERDTHIWSGLLIDQSKCRVSVW